MAAPTKSFTAIPNTSIDPDSPLDTVLFTAIRDNGEHLKEVLYGTFTPNAPHTHNGVDSALVETGPNAIRNGSFESDGDGWTITNYTGGSHSFNTANDMDGAKALAITSTSTVNGGAVAVSNEYRSCIGSEKIAVKLAYKASGANISSRARVIWYSDAQAQISTSDVYTTTNTPTAQTVATTVLTAPSTARFYRVELTGGVPGSGSGTGTVYFDGVKGEFSPPGNAICTYTGSLVESAGLNFPSSNTTSGGSTRDLGSNRVVTGLRFEWNNGDLNAYMRGYNILNT